MKQVVVFIFAFLYLVTTSGTTLHMHFCMGKLDDWSVGSKQEKQTCGRCGMEKTEKPIGCCSDKAKWIKIQDVQKASIYVSSFNSLIPTEAIHFSEIELQVPALESTDLHPQNHAPPDPAPIALYKRYCVFLI